MIKNSRAVIVLILIAAVTASAKVTTPAELISAMHAKYAGKWYKTLVFAQNTTSFRTDGTVKKELWYEAMSLPGKLRIDFDPPASRSGVLYTAATNYSFTEGKLVNSDRIDHPLLILGFDVYRQPVESTLEQLRRLKIDMGVLREDKWRGRTVYVVGAKKGDLKSPQFWIDKKRLYFVRMIQPGGRDGSGVQETEFNRYEKTGGGWVASEVVFIFNGRRILLEEYVNVRADVVLDEGLFDPEKWATQDLGYIGRYLASETRLR